MEKQKFLKCWFRFFVVLVLVSSIFAGCSRTQNEDQFQSPTVVPQETIGTEETEKSPEADVDIKKVESKKEDQKNSTYLAYYFDVNLQEQVLDAALFTDSLKKVAGQQAAEVEGVLTLLSAVKAAVISADYEELALSYPEQKIQERLVYYGIVCEKQEEDHAYLAVALDAGLIGEAEAKRALEGAGVSVPEATNLLMAVAIANSDARNFLGYSNDPQVVSRLDHSWNSFLIFDNQELTELGKTAVERGITTGYNLKSDQYQARFLPELTLQYGHDNIKHAHQLLALLNSENIVAKVQLEPKVSVYQYLLEWGPVPEPTSTYEVKQLDQDLYLVFAVEYDLMLEFDTDEDMLAFNHVIETYAKKYEGNEEGTGLLASSWWQPLYSTTAEGMPEEDYHLIYDCVISNEGYSIHPFTLPETMETVVEQFSEIASDQEVNPVARYCNTAFYNYLKGEDFQ